MHVLIWAYHRPGIINGEKRQRGYEVRHKQLITVLYHQRCLRIILKIHWSNFVTNVEVLQLAEITSIEAMLLKSQFRWAGHVSRMKDQRLPKITLYGELSTGHRDRGAPKKRYKDHLKKSLDNCHIDHHQWSTLAADREAWRGIIHQAVSSFEDTSRATLKDKRLRRKNRKTSAAAAATNSITSSSAATAAGLACPASASSATSMSAVDVDQLLHDVDQRNPNNPPPPKPTSMHWTFYQGAYFVVGSLILPTCISA